MTEYSDTRAERAILKKLAEYLCPHCKSGTPMTEVMGYPSVITHTLPESDGVSNSVICTARYVRAFAAEEGLKWWLDPDTGKQ